MANFNKNRKFNEDYKEVIGGKTRFSGSPKMSNSKQKERRSASKEKTQRRDEERLVAEVDSFGDVNAYLDAQAAKKQKQKSQENFMDSVNARKNGLSIEEYQEEQRKQRRRKPDDGNKGGKNNGRRYN